MVHAAHESHVAGDNAIDALVTGTTPLHHVQASSLDSADCELSRAAAVHAAVGFRDDVRAQVVMTADAELLFADCEFANIWNDISAAIGKLGGKDAHVTDTLTLEWRGFVDPTKVDTYLHEAQVFGQQSPQLAQRCNASACLACEQFADIPSGVRSKSAGEAEEAADPQDRSAGEANVGDHDESAGEAKATAGPQEESAGEANGGDHAESAGEAKATAGPHERSAGEANVGDHAESAREAPRYWPEVHVHGEDGIPRDKAPCMCPGIYNVMLSRGHIQLPVSADGECRKRGITRTCRARGGLQLACVYSAAAGGLRQIETELAIATLDDGRGAETRSAMNGLVFSNPIVAYESSRRRTGVLSGDVRWPYGEPLILSASRSRSDQKGGSIGSPRQLEYGARCV